MLGPKAMLREILGPTSYISGVGYVRSQPQNRLKKTGHLRNFSGKYTLW